MVLAVAHKGFVWFDIETFGVAAHGSRPHLGVDAIVKMGRVLVEVEKLDRDLRAHPTHRHLGSGSIHASLIQGGQEPSSYPAHCKLGVERRTIPGESMAVVEAELQGLLETCGRDDPAFRAQLSGGLARDPFEVDEAADIVQMCSAHLARVTGRPAEVGGVSYWADSALLAVAGIPTVLLGPTARRARGGGMDRPGERGAVRGRLHGGRAGAVPVRGCRSAYNHSSTRNAGWNGSTTRIPSRIRLCWRSSLRMTGV